MIPHGDTAIKKGDTIVIAAQEFHDDRSLVMQEIYIDKNHMWSNQTLKQISLDKGSLVIMIKRNDKSIIPDGNTIVLPEDLLIVAKH